MLVFLIAAVLIAAGLICERIEEAARAAEAIGRAILERDSGGSNASSSNNPKGVQSARRTFTVLVWMVLIALLIAVGAGVYYLAIGQASAVAQ